MAQTQKGLDCFASYFHRYRYQEVARNKLGFLEQGSICIKEMRVQTVTSTKPEFNQFIFFCNVGISGLIASGKVPIFQQLVNFLNETIIKK